MKRRMEDTSDILREIEAAPPTKKAMTEKDRELMGAAAVFAQPLIEQLPSQLSSLIARNMKTGVPTLPPPTEYEGLSEEEQGFVPAPDEEEFGFGLAGVEGEEGPIEPFLEQPTNVPEEGVPQEEYTPLSEGWSERTKKMHRFLHNKYMDEGEDEISYLDLIAGKSRKIVAGTFFELLVLKSKDIIELKQAEPYDNIFIRKTPKFFESQTVEV